MEEKINISLSSLSTGNVEMPDQVGHDGPHIAVAGERYSDNIEDYPGGIIVAIDKPYRWTSADVVRKVKFAACRHFHKKKLKVGHAGTLDPLATGVLLVCVGKATKLAEDLQKHDKEYVAGVTFGATTPSYDLEKEIDKMYPLDGVSEDALRGVLPSFLGDQEQIAPLFSAKSVDGVRAYEMARRAYKAAIRDGESFDHSLEETLSKQMIHISEIELLSFFESSTLTERYCLCARRHETPRRSTERCDGAGVARREQSEGGMPLGAVPKGLGVREQEERSSYEAKPIGLPSSRINVTDNSELGLPRAEIRVVCSKGTYIRALARDLGEALGSGAHLDSLRRTRTGDFRVENALTIEQAIELFKENNKN